MKAVMSIWALSGLFVVNSLSTVEVHAGVINEFNVVALNNFTARGNTGGRIFVGNDFTSTSSNLGEQLSSTTQDVLTVVGDINPGIASGVSFNLKQGNARLGGTKANQTQINFDGGGHQINDSSILSQTASVSNQIHSVSAYLNTLTATTTTTFSGDTNNLTVRYHAVANNDNISVFNVAASTHFNDSNIDKIQFSGINNNVEAVIINVSGTTINFDDNFIGQTNASMQSKVIFNFFEATTVNISNEFFGSILAPNAMLNINSTINGSVFAKDINQNGDIKLAMLTSAVPTPPAGQFVPEPASVLWALGGLMLTRRPARA
jgi:choice-of-anchor A domain-containing protein